MPGMLVLNGYRIRLESLTGRRWLRGRDQPVANSVPNTQPAFARPSGERRLGRLRRRQFIQLPAPASILVREGCLAEARGASEGGLISSQFHQHPSVTPVARIAYYSGASVQKAPENSPELALARTVLPESSMLGIGQRFVYMSLVRPTVCRHRTRCLGPRETDPDPWPIVLNHRASVRKSTWSFIGIFRPPPAFSVRPMRDCVPIPLEEKTGAPYCESPTPAAATGVDWPTRGREYKRMALKLSALMLPSPRRYATSVSTLSVDARAATGYGGAHGRCRGRPERYIRQSLRRYSANYAWAWLQESTRRARRQQICKPAWHLLSRLTAATRR